MRIIIPLAGRGNRVTGPVPKPLLPILQKTMIEWSVDSLNIPGNYIFITRIYDNPEWNRQLNAILYTIKPNCTIIPIDYVTEGPACSALLAKQYINNQEPLIITNCDQYLNWDSSYFLSYVRHNDCDGCVVTYMVEKAANSYAAVDLNGLVTRVAEKEIISPYSLNGIHYWKHGKDFVESAEAMINANDRVNNEFYVGPTYNYLPDKRIRIYNINVDQHWALGLDSDIETFKGYYENNFVQRYD